MVLAIAGCQTLGRAVFEEPVVALQDVRVSALGITGGTLDVVLGVYNPNGFKLDATRLTYRLFVDSIEVGDGELDERFSVQSGDTSMVRLPVRFTYSGLGRAGRQLMETGVVNYRVAGDLGVSTPLGNFMRPYDRSGRFNPLESRAR
jgi:LEA14-like dessication related protein